MNEEKNMTTFAKRLRNARKILGDTQTVVGAGVGYAHPQRRISEIERGEKEPGTAARKWLENYIRQAELTEKTGYAARCPACGAWNNNPTGDRRGDPGFDEILKQKCESCGREWWPPA